MFGAGTSCLVQPVSVLLRADGEAIRVKDDTPSEQQVKRTTSPVVFNNPGVDHAAIFDPASDLIVI